MPQSGLALVLRQTLSRRTLAWLYKVGRPIPWQPATQGDMPARVSVAKTAKKLTPQNQSQANHVGLHQRVGDDAYLARNLALTNQQVYYVAKKTASIEYCAVATHKYRGLQLEQWCFDNRGPPHRLAITSLLAGSVAGNVIGCSAQFKVLAP